MDIKDLNKVNSYLAEKKIPPLTAEQHASLFSMGIFPRVYPVRVERIPEKFLKDIDNEEWLELADADYTLEEFESMCNNNIEFDLDKFFIRFI